MLPYKESRDKSLFKGLGSDLGGEKTLYLLMMEESSSKFWRDERYPRRDIYRPGNYMTNLNSAALYSGTQDTNIPP